MSKLEPANWKKVVYEEGKDIRCAQGLAKDLGDFLEISGDFKIISINKRNVISIASKPGESSEKF